MPLSRTRRLFFVLLSIPAIFLFLLFLGSRRTLSDLFFTRGDDQSKLPDEIFGLLHFVTSSDEAGREFMSTIDDPVARDDANEEVIAVENGIELGTVLPENPVPMAWYALGSITKATEQEAARLSASGGWKERLEVLRKQCPLVVFSKSYCPYSKRAKKLLETYNLSPPPKIVEVDLRADASELKVLLTRLTGQSTFPNVILHGQSLGGSDDLMRLHARGQLGPMLKAAGMRVSDTGADGSTSSE